MSVYTVQTNVGIRYVRASSAREAHNIARRSVVADMIDSHGGDKETPESIYNKVRVYVQPRPVADCVAHIGLDRVYDDWVNRDWPIIGSRIKQVAMQVRQRDTSSQAFFKYAEKRKDKMIGALIRLMGK